MSYDPKIHHRKSIRLKGYDYRWPGNYFVTICTEDKGNVLGKIINNQMVLNLAGEMADRWLKELENKFKDVTLCGYVIMPNHIHTIIYTSPIILPKENKKVETILKIVGADLNIRPERTNIQINQKPNIERTVIRANYGCDLNIEPYAQGGYANPPLQSNNNNLSQNNLCTSLSKIIQWFKIMTTDEYIKNVKQNN